MIHTLQDLCYAYAVADPVREMLFALQDRIDALEVQRKPLTDDAVGFECRKHFWMHGTRFEDAYKLGFRDAEAAHNIKEGI